MALLTPAPDPRALAKDFEEEPGSALVVSVRGVIE